MSTRTIMITGPQVTVPSQNKTVATVDGKVDFAKIRGKYASRAVKGIKPRQHAKP